MRMLYVIKPVDRESLLTDLVPSLSVLTSDGWMMVPHRGTATTGALAPPQPPTHVNQSSFFLSLLMPQRHDCSHPEEVYTVTSMLCCSHNTNYTIQSVSDRCSSVFVSTCSAQQRNVVNKKRAIPNQVLNSFAFPHSLIFTDVFPCIPTSPLFHYYP